MRHSFLLIINKNYVTTKAITVQIICLNILDYLMTKLTMLQAFEAMKVFLDEYYKLTKSDDVGGLLGDMQLLQDGATADPATWGEWEESVEKVLQPGFKPMMLELSNPKKKIK